MSLSKNNHYLNLDHSGLLTEMGREAFKKNIPLFTTLELSQNCNFKCGHCYNFDRTVPVRSENNQSSLTFENWVTVIDDIMKEGAFYICFTGGEVLLYPRLWELADEVTKRNGVVKLKSNGALLTDENISKILAHKVSSIEISLYGMSEESYSRFIGKSGMFDRTISGIKKLSAKNVSVTLNIILNRINVNEIDSMVEFAETLNVPFNFSDEITRRFDETDSSLDFNLTNDQYETLLNGKYGKYFSIRNDLSEHSFQCSCARNVCGIGFNGDVYPCIGAPIKVANILEKPFKDIWEHSPEFNKIRGLKNEDFKECITCDVAEFCNRSSGSAYANTKDYLGCDPVSHRFAELRKRNIR